jgi:hypothetical protein
MLNRREQMEVKANGMVDVVDRKTGKTVELWPVDAREALSHPESVYTTPEQMKAEQDAKKESATKTDKGKASEDDKKPPTK